ncbi:MAG: hypothetical protein A2Z01_07790, partial [Betaproteobacteria bacterium RBG_16_58_11]
KAVILRFIERVSGYSRQQITRLVKRGCERRQLVKRYQGSRTSFARIKKRRKRRGQSEGVTPLPVSTVEPVFGNLRGNKRLHCFTLRGKTKVDGQWKLYCMMHNIVKLAKHGYARLSGKDRPMRPGIACMGLVGRSDSQ